MTTVVVGAGIIGTAIAYELQKRGRQVVLEGRRQTLTETARALHEELAKPNYRLQLRLHKDIDESRIGASVDNGFLTLVLPVREAAKPRTISVG